MNWWQRLRWRGRMEDELDAELRFHFDRLVADYTAEGLSEEEARQRARAEFGGVEAIKDDCCDASSCRSSSASSSAGSRERPGTPIPAPPISRGRRFWYWW